MWGTEGQNEGPHDQILCGRVREQDQILKDCSLAAEGEETGKVLIILTLVV